MTRDIPGFYFDESRGRYFRIQPDHRVVSNDSSRRSNGAQDSVPKSIYSRSAVKRKREEKRRKADSETWTEKMERGTVRRSLFDHPGQADSEILLDRRLGERRTQRGQGHSSSEKIARSWATGLQYRHLMSSRRFGPSFVVDPHTATLMIGAMPQLSGDRLFEVIPAGSDGQMGPPDENDRWKHGIASLPPFALQGTSYPMAIFERGYDRGIGLVTASARHRSGVPHSQIVTLWDITNRPGQPAILEDRMTYDVQYTINDLDVARHPFGADSLTAVATSNGIIFIACEGQFQDGPLDFTKGKEQMAVRFSTLQPYVLFCGDRSGRVLLSDLRAGGTILRVGHDSATSAIRAINESLLLVHGLNSTSVYDLRYAKPPAVLSKVSSTSGAPSRRCFTPTTPYLSFAIPVDRQSDRYGTGFAFDDEMNIVAVASSNNLHGHRVSVYSVSTGRRISGYPQLLNCPWTEQVTCLDFARLRDGPKSLISRSKQFVDEWTPMLARSPVPENRKET